MFLILDNHARGEFLVGKKYTGYIDRLLEMEDDVINRFETMAENLDELSAG